MKSQIDKLNPGNLVYCEIFVAIQLKGIEEAHGGQFVPHHKDIVCYPQVNVTNDLSRILGDGNLASF